MRGQRIGNYVLSLPERLLRSVSAVTGGLVRELGDATLPAAVRRTRLYQALVDSTLRFLIEQVGEVEGIYPPEGKLAENFALRRTAGNGLEMLGIMTFRASPVWVLAALADATGAGRHLIREIGDELQREGLLEAGRPFETVDQMLDGLEQTSAKLADTINTPPLDIDGLRADWADLRRHAAAIPPKRLPSIDALTRSWTDLGAVADAERRSVFEVSTLVAISAVSRLPERVRWLSQCAGSAARKTRQVLASNLLDHYTDTLADLRRLGFAAYWAQEFRPYLRAAALQFSPKRATATERWLKRTD